MRAFPVKLPSLVRYWTVVDDGYRVVRVADEYLRHLRLGQDAAESTTKAYAEALVLYLRWCEQTSRDWRTAVERLGGFITWLKHTPSDPDAPVSRVPRVQRIPERSSNRSAREARPPALLLPRPSTSASVTRIHLPSGMSAVCVMGILGLNTSAREPSADPGPCSRDRRSCTDGWRNSRTPGGISSGGACSAHTWVSSDTSRPRSASCCVSPWQRDPGDVSCGGWGCQVPHGACQVILFLLSVRAESGRRSPGNRGEGPLAGPGAVLSVGDYFKGSEPGS